VVARKNIQTYKYGDKQQIAKEKRQLICPSLLVELPLTMLFNLLLTCFNRIM